MSAMFPIVLQPGESRLCDMDFGRVVGRDVTLSGVIESRQSNVGLVDGSPDVTVGQGTVSGQRAQVRITVPPTGAAGEDYVISLVCNDSRGDTVEGDGLLQVRDLP